MLHHLTSSRKNPPTCPKHFASVQDLYSNQNVGAVILASDGIYNEGSNPLYANFELNAPIHVIALGDTVPSRDVILKRVFP